MNEFTPTIFFCEITNIDIEPEILRKLPDERQQRINNSLRRENAKQLYVSSLLLGYVLNKYGMMLSELKTTETGKPYVEAQFCFNISHSGRYVVIALDKDEVGVDIQEKNPISNNAAKIFFGSEESSPLLNTQYCYSYIWCRKEALLKCLGVGWNGKNEHKLSVIKNKVQYDNNEYYLTDYTIFENYFLTLCEKRVHKEFVIKEVSKRELELLYRTN